MAEVIKAEWDHIEPIASNMREADVLEIWLLGHKMPIESMQNGFKLSVKSWTIMEAGTPIGMFGVSSLSILGNIGIPWLIGTDEMLKIRRQFVRESMTYLAEVLRLYPFLTNFVHVDNVASLRWLSWMGFDFDGPMKAGPENADFFRFERTADV